MAVSKLNLNLLRLSCTACTTAVLTMLDQRSSITSKHTNVCMLTKALPDQLSFSRALLLLASLSVSLALGIQLYCHAFMSCAYLLCLLNSSSPPLPLPLSRSLSQNPLRCIVQLKASALSLPRLSWTSGAISLYFNIHTHVCVCLYVSLFACLSFWLLAYLICAFKHFKQAAAAAVDALSHLFLLLPLPHTHSHSLSLTLFCLFVALTCSALPTPSATATPHSKFSLEQF